MVINYDKVRKELDASQLNS